MPKNRLSSCSIRISCLPLLHSLTSWTYLKSSSKATFCWGSTLLQFSNTSLRVGTSSSIIVCSIYFQGGLNSFRQQLSISTSQNFYNRDCFCISLSKTPNCGVSLSVENALSCLLRVGGSKERLLGLGLFLIFLLLWLEFLESESSSTFSSSSTLGSIVKYYLIEFQFEPISEIIKSHLKLIDLDLYRYQLRMGKAGKGKKKDSSQEEEEEEEVSEELEEEEEEGDSVPQLAQQDDEQMQERIMNEIMDHASKATDSQKLTWNAIYSLKAKEIEFNVQMKQEIEKIKERYELLKQPIYHQISAAVLGQKVTDTLYQPQGIASTIDCKKVNPQKLENFWGIVLDKQGLLTEQIDVDCITKVNFFNCELLDHDTNHMRITFRFDSQTSYFKNTELSVESRFDVDKNEPIRTIKQELKYKKEKVEHSLFTLLFDSSVDINQFYNVACELYQDYSNSLYYYLREEDEEDDAIEEHEDESDQDDDEVEEVKPTKKVKKDQPKQPQEKPECKNQ